MKLGKRLKQLDAMVSPGYDHIWDCCCDHGFLGSALLSRAAAPHIHFVDVVPALINDLEGKLQQNQSAFPAAWTTHNIDARALPLTQYDGRHLIIIAGVGGELTGQLVKAIHDRSPDLALDFLLCPVRQQFALREQLIRLKLILESEVLTEENRRFYEILLVTSAAGSGGRVSLVGDRMWRAESPEQARIAKDYLAQTLSHYQRAQLHRSADAQPILEAYQALASRLGELWWRDRED